MGGMSGHKEIIATMKKKYNIGSGSAVIEKKTEVPRYKQMIDSAKKKYVISVDENYINSFFKDVKQFFTQTDTDSKTLGYSNAAQLYDTKKASVADFQKRANAISNFIEQNKGNLKQEDYDSLTASMKSIGDGLSQVSKGYLDAKNYYSKWDTEEDYNAAVKEYEREQGYLNYDVSAGEAKLAELENRIMVEIPKQREELGTKIRSTKNKALQQQYHEEVLRLEELEYQLQDEYDDLEVYLNNAKRKQQWAALAKVSQNEDFKENSGYSPTGLDYKNPMVAVYSTDIDALTYEYINNVDRAREYIASNYAFTWNGAFENYQQMKPEEIATYNYYYKTSGAEKAQEYLDSIQETLNARAGTLFGEWIADKPVLPYLYAVVAGLDQFGSGVENAVNALVGKDTYIPVSSTQYASGAIRDKLGESGAKLPDWLGGGTLGQAVYDTINTGANMAPSILVSYLTGGIGGAALGSTVGAATLGVSAAGNAYQQVLNLGYGKDKAFAYGTMIGVSEATLEKLLGGIGAFGGTSGAVKKLATNAVSKIDNALLRFSLKYGAQLAGKVGSEALEEGLQSVLEPVFQQAILNNDADVDWEEVAYSALLGGAMGGLFGGFELGTEIKAEREANVSLGKKAKVQENFKAELEGVIQEAMKLPETAEAHHLAVAAQKKIAAGKELTDAEVGALYRETATQISGENKNEQPIQDNIQEQIGKETDSDALGIKDQIRNNKEVLDAMDPQAEIKVPIEYFAMDIAGKKQWVLEKLRPTGYQVERKGFGIIDFAKKRLKKAFNYFESGTVEEAAFEAIPYVLKNGVEITTRSDHKGRNYGTVTIAAPVLINGKRGNMAVVVKKTDGNHYKVHRILTPDGSVFVLPETANEAESTPSGESPKTGSLATTKDSASNIIISNSSEIVNNEGGNQNGQATGNQPVGAADLSAGQGNIGGTVVSDGERGGTIGAGAYEQAASVARGARGSQGADERRAARERNTRNEALRNAVRDVLPRSPAKLGIPGGEQDATLKIVPVAYQTEEMKQVEAWFAEHGISAYFFVGSLSIQQSGKHFTANGMLHGDRVFIRADSPFFDLEQIAEHEKFHLLKRENPGLVEQLMYELQNEYSPEAFKQIVDKYVKAYGKVIDMSREDAELRIWNEILADAYAGMNARVVDVAAYQDDVAQRVQKYTGEGRQAQSNGVRQTNGPNSQAIENEAEFSLAEIIDANNKSYGIGVKLDSTLLDSLSDDERIQMVKEYVKELGGSVFTAYDASGNEVDITIAKMSAEFKNTKGKRVAVNKDLTRKYIRNEPKQEAITLIDELIVTAKYDGSKAPLYSHGWLDNYGRNNWEYWTTYIEDKSGTIWEATLNVANTTRGEKILYDIYPIKKVGRSVKSDTLPTKSSIRNSSGNVNSENVEEEFALGSEPVDTDMDIEERMRHYANVPEYQPGMESNGAAAEDVDVDELLRWDEPVNGRRQNAGFVNVPKSEFEGTPHLRELGVQIENSVGDYWGTAAAVAHDKAAKQMKRQIKRAEIQLNASEAEKDFAAGIAAGRYYAEDIPGRFDYDVVMELADYYAAEAALDTDMLREKKASISNGLFETMKELFKDSDAFTPSRALVMNYRTPERNMLKIFGEKRGKEINDALFSAVAVNEAERYRFMNRMFDEVRTFEDSNGKRRELTKEERAMVMMHIEGKAASEIAAGMEMAGPIQNAASNIAKGDDSGDAAREWGLGREERRLAEQVAVWIEVKEAMDSGKIDAKLVDEAAKKYSEMFNKFYDAINDFLVAHGYETIGFVRGYAPHIQPEQVRTTMNKAFHKMGIDADVGNLPASIAGMTADFKPNKRWNPHMQHRRTIKTQYDIAKAYESYVEYMSDILYHTDDIMRVRQAANYFRRTYAPEEIKNMLEWAEELRKEKRPEQKAAFLRANGKLGDTSFMSAKDIDERFYEFVDEQYQQIENAGKYSEFVKYLENYANILAGKQSYRDRGAEANGREIMAAGNKLVRTFARSQVAGSISSALNQTAQLPQIIAEVGDVNVAQALWDIVSGKLKKGAWAQESDFLVGKEGVDFLVTEGGEKMVSNLFKPATFVDGLISTLAVRGEYLKQVKAGKNHQEAMKLADKKGTAIMGSRMKGSKPVAFHAKNFWDSIINVFQIEALNSWEHLSQDLPRDFQEIAAQKGKRAAAGALAGVLVKMILAAFVINRLDDELYGGTPAPFDVLGLTANFIASGEGLTTNQYLCTVFDNAWEKMTGERPFDTDPSELGDGFEWKNAVEDTVYNISNEVPFLRNVSALVGAGDDTLPLPDIAGTVKDGYEAILEGKPEKLPEVAFGLATDFIPGGRQLEKTAQGLETFFRGGKYSGYGDSKKLQYPVEQNVVNFIKAALFGRSGLGQAEFYADGGQGISEKQTKAFEKLVDAGFSGEEIYDLMTGFRDLEPEEGKESVSNLQKCMEVAGTVWSDEMKAATLETMMTESSYKKYKTALDAGITTYWYFQFLDKIKDAKSDDRSTKKEKVVKEIDRMDFTRKQKDTLYLLQGYAESGLKDTPWH